MPNWTYNILSTKNANEDTRKKFHESITDKNSDGKEFITYNKLIPMPDEIRNTISGSVVFLGNFMLLGTSNINANNIETIKENRLKEVIVFDSSKIDDNYIKTVYELSDLYFVDNLDKKTVTYQELVDWIINKDTTNYLYKSFVDSAKEALLESNKQISNTIKYGVPDWYAWSNKHWGVKWDASNSEVIDNNGEISYRFDSPWGCPEGFFEALSATFPEVQFHVNAEFEGETIVANMVWLNGECIVDEENTLPFYDNKEDCYEYDELERNDPYFGDWYYEYDMSTDIYHPKGLPAVLEVKLELTDAGFTVNYTFRSSKANPGIVFGTHTGNTYPETMRGMDMIEQDLIASKDALEEKFGHMLHWWFNKPINK